MNHHAAPPRVPPPRRRPASAITVALLAFASGSSAAAPGAPAGPAVDIDATAGVAQTSPRVGRATDGTTVVVWEQSAGRGLQSIRGRRFAADGSPLDDGFVIAVVGAPFQDLRVVSDLAVAADGSFAVVWSVSRVDFPQPFTIATSVLMRRYAADGVPIGEMIEVANDADSIASIPSVAIDRDGDTIVGWSSSRVRFGENRYAFIIFAGGAVRGSLDERRIVARRFDRNGRPIGERVDVARRAERDATGVVASIAATAVVRVTQEIDGVDVATDDDGDFVMTWRESLTPQLYAGVPVPLSTGTRVFSAPQAVTLQLRRFTSTGQPLDSAPVLIRAPGGSVAGGQLSLPVVALANDGLATVSWCESQGLGTRIRVRQVPPQTGLAVDRASIPVAFDCSTPRVAITGLGDGRYALAWTDSIANAPQPDAGAVRSRVYAGNGEPLGPVVDVATVPGQRLLEPAVALVPDGALSLVWTTSEPRTARLRQYRAP